VTTPPGRTVTVPVTYRCSNCGATAGTHVPATRRDIARLELRARLARDGWGWDGDEATCGDCNTAIDQEEL
jgi:hypothetical protein